MNLHTYFFSFLYSVTLDSVAHMSPFLFVFLFWLSWVFIAAHGLSLVAASGGYSSFRWLLLLRSTGCGCMGSVVVVRGLYSTGSVVVARGFSSCGSRVLECRLSCGTWTQ